MNRLRICEDCVIDLLWLVPHTELTPVHQSMCQSLAARQRNSSRGVSGIRRYCQQTDHERALPTNSP